MGAIGELLRALELDPGYFEARSDLAVAYFQSRNYNDAGLEYRKLLLLRPDAGAHFGLGLVLRQQGDHDGAVREFQSALKARPDFPDARYYLAITQGQKTVDAKER